MHACACARTLTHTQWVGCMICMTRGRAIGCTTKISKGCICIRHRRGSLVWIRSKPIKKQKAKILHKVGGASHVGVLLSVGKASQKESFTWRVWMKVMLRKVTHWQLKALIMVVIYIHSRDGLGAERSALFRVRAPRKRKVLIGIMYICVVWGGSKNTNFI